MTAPVIIRADRLAALMPECRDPAEIEIRERLLMGCDTAQAALARDWDKSSAPLLQMMTGIGRSFAFAHVGLDQLAEARAVMLDLMRLTVKVEALHGD